jgi:TonB C terminal
MGDHGGYTLDPANPGGDGRSRSPGRRQAPAPFQSPVSVKSVGLGAAGTPGAPNMNLPGLPVVAAAVGDKQLKAERAADGASRRSRHRGSWETNKFEQWRAAIENYEPAVKLGNQNALNAARVPFATYINSIHNRLHPIFAEEFLASLDSLPKGNGMNQNLVTHVEIVLTRDQGRIVRMGITKASGNTAFDIVALNSVERAQPFGKAPDAIVSPDGNVYLHWEFHRDPYDACTTRNARPFMLKSAPTLTPKPGAPKKGPGPTPSDERRPLLPTRDP